MKNKDKLRYGQKAALLTVCISAGLSILKAVFGILSGALVLLTDALESATDIVTGLCAYLGLRIAEKKPDKRFQYGYYKAESLASLLIGGLIIYAAVLFAFKGYERIFLLPEISFVGVTMGVAVLSGIMAFVMFKYLGKTGRSINSGSLIASSKDRLKDVFASLIVLVGILFTYLKIPYGEGIITIFVSLLILKIGLGTLKDSIFALMDVSPSKTIEKQIVQILKDNRGALHFEKLRLRKSGPYIFGEAHILVRKTANVQRAHDVSDEIEALIKKRIPEIESFTIHIEPFRSASVKLLIPVSDKNHMSSKVNGHFARARYYLFVQIQERRIKSHYLKDNLSAKKDVRAGLSAAKEVLKENIDAVVLKRVGEISFHTLRDNLIDIYLTKGDTAKDIVDNFMQGRLRLVTEPTHSSDKGGG